MVSCPDGEAISCKDSVTMPNNSVRYHSFHGLFCSARDCSWTPRRTSMWTRPRSRSRRSSSSRRRSSIRRRSSSSRRTRIMRLRKRTRRRRGLTAFLIFECSFLFTFICSGNFQFYIWAFHLLDPDPHLSMRIRIQEASDNADPEWSGSETLL